MENCLKTRNFSKWAAKAGLSDRVLKAAFHEILNGLVDADLGGGVIKKRVALPGRGKSGSARTILATNKKDRWIFLFGFEKNDLDNISSKELEALQLLAGDLLKLTKNQVNMAIKDGALVEIEDEKDN